MYTITRKLAVVCLAVVLSVLMYGCGGGDSKQAEMMTPPSDGDGTDTTVVVAPHTVNTDFLLAGLTITPDTYNIEPGETADAGDATLRCPDGGGACVVTVDADGVTSTGTGGMATAMLSVDGILKLHTPNEVDLDDLDENYRVIPEVVEPITIQPAGNMDIGDANFACPEDGVRCIVTVDEDGKVTSTGGTATLEGISMAAMTTGTAKALSVDADTDVEDGALVQPAMEPDAPNNLLTEVKRGPDGVTTITLKNSGTDTDKYTSEAVDTDHEITGWMGLTLKRNDAMAATDTDDAVSATMMDEATFYTNIESAKAAKLTYKEVPDPQDDDTLVLAIDRNQDADDIAEDEEFTGYYIRSDSSRIHGTFKCTTDECLPVVIPTIPTGEGNLVLEAHLTGWAFESDNEEKEGEKIDEDYMYFGYWLQSPVEPSDVVTAYNFAAYAGGGIAPFMVTSRLLDNIDAALKATYEGGAAGRYVTRELRLNGVELDQFSPGTHGRFTAKAELTAYFTKHSSFEEANQQHISGTITEFMDGAKELGFEVELGLAAMAPNTTGVASEDIGKTTFGDGDVTGNWAANFYGPAADTNVRTREDADNKLPSGVAGTFNVGSDYTRVTGGFAATKQ